jgi:hypothetical protein
MRAILKYSGVLYQLHLEGGVKKGALTQEQADEKLKTWLEEKAAKIGAKRDAISNDKSQKETSALAYETKVKEERAAKILAKTSAIAAAVEADAASAEAAEAPAEGSEAPAADAAPEAPAETAPEAPAAEAAPEAPVEAAPEATEAPAAEVVPEAPAAESTPEAPTEAKPAEGSEPAAEEGKGE